MVNRRGSCSSKLLAYGGSSSSAEVVANGEADPIRRYWPTAKQILCGGSGRWGSSFGAEVVATGKQLRCGGSGRRGSRSGAEAVETPSRWASVEGNGDRCEVEAGTHSRGY